MGESSVTDGLDPAPSPAPRPCRHGAHTSSTAGCAQWPALSPARCRGPQLRHASLRVCNSLSSLHRVFTALQRASSKQTKLQTFPIVRARGLLWVPFVDNGTSELSLPPAEHPEAPRDGDRMGQYEEITQSPPPHRPGRPTIIAKRAAPPAPSSQRMADELLGFRGGRDGAPAKGLPMDGFVGVCEPEPVQASSKRPPPPHPPPGPRLTAVG